MALKQIIGSLTSYSSHRTWYNIHGYGPAHNKQCRLARPKAYARSPRIARPLYGCVKTHENEELRLRRLCLHVCTSPSALLPSPCSATHTELEIIKKHTHTHTELVTTSGHLRSSRLLETWGMVTRSGTSKVETMSIFWSLELCSSSHFMKDLSFCELINNVKLYVSRKRFETVLLLKKISKSTKSGGWWRG